MLQLFLSIQQDAQVRCMTEELRQALLDATDELHALVLGDVGLLTNLNVCQSLHLQLLTMLR